MKGNLDPNLLNHVYSTYRQCLEAMGINCTLGCDAPEELQHIKSGESFFLEETLKPLVSSSPVVFDVGANVGRYATTVSSIFPAAQLYCFEPHPESFKKLNSKDLSAKTFPIAVGAENHKCTLFERVDYPDGSEMASVHEKVITEFHNVDSVKIEVDMKTIDQIMEEENLDSIDFLKIDVEGHELAVVKGAQKSIREGKIKVIQYEFNHPNIESKAFMRDFRNELKEYEFYRLLEHGMLPVLDHPIFQEIFGYQNIIAIYRPFLEGPEPSTPPITTVEQRAQKLYPDCLFDKSFNDGHLGGCNVEGDPATHYPIMWRYLVDLLDIKSVVDIGCGFGYSLDFFKNKMGLEAIGIEGSAKVQKLALNNDLITVHDYCAAPLKLDKNWDLAWSSEFVEHVPPQFVENFIATFKCCKYLGITYASPGQSGHHHVNENTDNYWIDLMAKHGMTYDADLTLQLRSKTQEDFADARSPVDQSKVNNWTYPYLFSSKGLFFRNDLLL